MDFSPRDKLLANLQISEFGLETRFPWRQFVWTKVHTTDASTHSCAIEVQKMEAPSDVLSHSQNHLQSTVRFSLLRISRIARPTHVVFARIG